MLNSARRGLADRRMRYSRYSLPIANTLLFWGLTSITGSQISSLTGVTITIRSPNGAEFRPFGRLDLSTHSDC